MTTGTIAIVFAIAAAVIVAVFAYVALRSGGATEVDYGAATHLRRGFFLGFTALLVVGLVLTLPRMPYPATMGPADRIVHVTGKQYAFALTDAPVTTLQGWEDGVYPQVAEVKAGSTVEFRVTTLDVNHGFSVYSPDGELMAQTQAMPGYVNRLRLRFERPGTYTVFCLEYCGMGHHRMRGAIEVR
jgi:cytochrome c oxidase subunit II